MLKTLKPEDITPENVSIVPKRDKILVIEPGEDISATIGGIGTRLASTVSDAINQDGNLVNDVINAKLDTDAKEILGEFTFGASGAIAIATDINNGLWISPTGILAKKLGANTLTITSSGDVTMVGTVTASAGSIGGWSIGANTLAGGVVTLNSTGLISVGSGNAIFKADSNGIYLGNATFGSAPFRVDMTGHVTASDLTLTNASLGAGSAYTGNVIAAAYIGDLNASKITAGTINASVITVTNLNADNITTGTLTSRTVQSSSGDNRIVLNTGDYIDFYAGGVLRGSLRATTGGAGGLKLVDGDMAISNPHSLIMEENIANRFASLGCNGSGQLVMGMPSINEFYLKDYAGSTNLFTVSPTNGLFSHKNGFSIGRWFNNGGAPINAGSGIFYTYTLQSFAAGWTAGSIDYTTIGALDFTSETFGIWPSIETTVQADFVCHTYNYSTTGFQYIVHNPTAGNVTLTVRFLVFGR